MNLVRPKLHYSLHLPDQWSKKKRSFDAFPTERKHKYYKSQIAPRLKNLSTLSAAALLELGENDLKIQEHDKSVATQLLSGKDTSLSETVRRQMERDSWQITKQLQHRAVIHGAEQFKFLPGGSAVEIVAAAERKGAFFLLGLPLQLENQKSSTFTVWSRAVRQADMLLLSVNDLASCGNAALSRVETNDPKLSVSLMLG